MSNRSAIDTIKGYFYQFDYTIEKILNLPNDLDEVIVEGIEDIDIESSSGESMAVQCKYYSKTEYNHSVIAKPIRLMLTHFKKVKTGDAKKMKYHLYGHYKSGQDKLTLPLEVKFLKEKFLTYKSNSAKHEHHLDLGLSDLDLENFLGLLSIDINAREYEAQLNGIKTSLSSSFSCDDFEAEYHYYNNALNEIRKIAIEDNLNLRRISKRDFLNKINYKKVLFDKWFFQLKGQKQYHKELKSRYFTHLNKSSFERFFIVELSNYYVLSEVKEILHIISNRYSKLSKREPNNFCPYICFPNINEVDLLELKNQLYNEDFNFIDGYPYEGSDFKFRAINTTVTSGNQIQIKILKDITEVDMSLREISGTKEVYQFYFIDKPLVVNNMTTKDVAIQIIDINHIKEII